MIRHCVQERERGWIRSRYACILAGREGGEDLLCEFSTRHHRSGAEDKLKRKIIGKGKNC